MEKKRVVIAGVYLPGIYPRGDNSVEAHLLAPAFLKTYADADPEIYENYEIIILNLPASLGAEQIASRIMFKKPHIVAYSVYVWNYDIIRESTKIAREEDSPLP